MEVALIPVIESAFNPHAYSRARASGLWQFIPSTGKLYGLSQDAWNDNRRDVVAATDAALNYLQRLHDEFQSWELAFAAYNCGEGCVGRAIAANQRRGLPTDYLSLRLPNETVHYVPKLIAVKNLILAPSFYGVELGSIPDRPYFTTVPAPPRIDVSLAAKLAEMPVEEFIALNPSHNKAVAVAKEGTLVVPLDRAEAFRENLDKWNRELVTWQPVAGKKGEAVTDIARRYGISVAELRQANNLQLARTGHLAHAQPVLVPGHAIAAAQAKAPPRTATAKGGSQTGKGSQTASARTDPRAETAPPIYVVRAGDSLWSISKEVGRELSELLSLNNLTEKSILRPGMRLRLN
jgi:membrane-bound lytic murein transglycosylase D